MKAASEKRMSKILIIGGTGYIGSYMVRESLSLGHPTYVYARPPTTPSKIDLHNHFKSLGVIIIQGQLSDKEKLVSVIEKVDIVISTLAYPQVLDQFNIIDAIKIAGNIKRFLPSDFGVEEDRVTALPPFQEFLEKKRKIRRAIEQAAIPYTFVSAGCFGSYFVNYLLRPHDQHDDITVYGTGEAKAVLNYEKDIATYTIKIADDPRACNRVVSYRPPKNIISQLELISLWEQKLGRCFNKVHTPEEDIVKLTETLPSPQNLPVSILHSLFVKGSTLSFEIEDKDIEVSRLYSDFAYTSIDELLDIFLVDPPKPANAAFE